MDIKNLTPHGRGVRGLNLPRSSQSFGGNFGRIFRSLPAANFGPDDKKNLENLKLLGTAMLGPDDPPKDGPDAEESGIPALYTYLGQFVDHDLTFDPASSLQQQDDPDALVDFRTARSDFDNLYGKGPDDAPYLYHSNGHFILGRALTGAGSNLNARDLPRSAPTAAGAEDIHDARRAIIGDPRNDE